MDMKSTIPNTHSQFLNNSATATWFKQNGAFIPDLLFVKELNAINNA